MQSFTPTVIVTNSKDAITLKAALESYLSWCASGDTHTARAKRYDIRYFYEYCLELLGPNPMLHEVTVDILKGGRDYRATKEAPATVNRRVATWKHFTKHTSRKLKDFIDPGPEVKLLRVEELQPDWLSDEDLELLRFYAGNVGSNEFFRARNHVAIESSLCLGLRREEITNITEGQLSADLSEITKVKGKGQTYHDLPITARFRPILEKYLAIRFRTLCEKDPMYRNGDKNFRDAYPLIVSLHGNKTGVASTYFTDPKSIWRIFSMAGQVAGVKDMRTHRARHTFVNELHKRTGDLRLTSKAARHANVNTTMRYLTPAKTQLYNAFEG